MKKYIELEFKIKELNAKILKEELENRKIDP